MRSFTGVIIISLCCLFTGLLTRAQVEQTKAPANAELRRIQNIAPEEMWNRVTECTLPRYPAVAIDTHITGTVDIGLGVSPEGEVGRTLVCLMVLRCWLNRQWMRCANGNSGQM